MANYLLKSKNVVQNFKPITVFSYTFCRSFCNNSHFPQNRQTFQSRKHRVPVAFQEKVPIFFNFWRSESVKPQNEFNPMQNVDDSEVFSLLLVLAFFLFACFFASWTVYKLHAAIQFLNVYCPFMLNLCGKIDLKLGSNSHFKFIFICFWFLFSLILNLEPNLTVV